MGKITQVIKRSGAVVDFNPDRITNAIYRAAVAVGGRDRETAEKLSQEVVTLLEKNTPEGNSPSIEEIQDIVEKVLIENGHAKVAKAYILYREERARRRLERANLAAMPSDNIPWAKVWASLDWAVDHGVNSVDGLNQRIARGEFTKIIAESEAAYNEDVENAAEMIAQAAERLTANKPLKIVIVCGPSSSGKTTTTTKVAQRLGHKGMKLITLNVDNYFYDLEMHPKDEFGDYDFETPQALNLQLINQHLHQLIRGQEVRIPFYDFRTGHNYPDRTPMKLNPSDVILIDSLHGLYPAMTEGVENEQIFRLYLEPLLQMKDQNGEYVRWTDIRLIRRMLRDTAFRAYDPQKTLLHWHYVRSSEMRNIIPYHSTSNYIVNSAMPYELPIYCAKMLDQFRQWTENLQGDPLREDAHTRASRLYKLLQQITPVADESAIPADSVVREFIGGSIYHY